MQFPKDFIWGAAAASYQIEGAAAEDGRGLCVWDMFSRQPGKVWRNQNGATACDHYHRFREDVDLMADLGLQAYRFSVSWPRVIPAGTGSINQAGLDFYDKLVDALLEKNIQPWLTLFHWDYPYELYCRGGWLSPDSSDWFADYTAVMVERLSDRVQHWIPQNEPQCFLGLGHVTGNHAPGMKMGTAEAMLAVHNSLLAHGKAVQVIRAKAVLPPVIGTAPAGKVCIPRTASAEDIAAARQATFSNTTKDIYSNSIFTDPLILGHYPEDCIQVMGADMPNVTEQDMRTICQPLDFYGVNLYFGHWVEATEHGGWQPAESVIGPPLTTMEWEVSPAVLYWGARFLHERYKLPIVITENGMANTDWIHLDGKVHDPQRIDYLHRHLREFARASAEGIPCLGYMQWSIMDNFEWGHGYKQRFGLIYVDYETGRRVPKDSYYWYRNVIKTNGTEL